jgi:hypothetical protein
MAILCFLLGAYGLAERRSWWTRQTGRGSCQFCGRPFTVRVVACCGCQGVLLGVLVVRA